MQVNAPARRARTPSMLRRRRRRLPMWVAIPLWIVIALLAVVLGFRLLAWDEFEPFAVLNTVTAFVYLPAWIVLIVAAVGRRPILAGAALLIVVAQIGLLLPELTAAEPVPAWTANAPTFRMLDANVYDDNSSMTGYAAEISAVRPQLLTMEEATPKLTAELGRAGGLAGLPYRVEVKRNDPTAFLVASRYRLTRVNVISFDYSPFIVQATVELPSGPQPLWVLHTIAPLPISFSEWKGQLATIARLLRARGPSGLLIAGDFNATWGNHGFRAILDAGMTDAAAARGKAFDMTWSQTKPLLPRWSGSTICSPGQASPSPRSGPTQVRAATIVI